MLKELDGDGWRVVEPPLESDDENVVARLDGEPIKAGFLMDIIEEDDTLFHAKYRSGQYNLEVRIEFTIGRGQVKVEEADGYEG